jgi:hypothetical protein
MGGRKATFRLVLGGVAVAGLLAAGASVWALNDDAARQPAAAVPAAPEWPDPITVGYGTVYEPVSQATMNWPNDPGVGIMAHDEGGQLAVGISCTGPANGSEASIEFRDKPVVGSSAACGVEPAIVKLQDSAGGGRLTLSAKKGTGPGGKAAWTMTVYAAKPAR